VQSLRIQSFVQSLSKRIARWWRFPLDIAGANEVDIFIDYRATSADQFNGISEIISVVGV